MSLYDFRTDDYAAHAAPWSARETADPDYSTLDDPDILDSPCVRWDSSPELWLLTAVDHILDLESLHEAEEL